MEIISLKENLTRGRKDVESRERKVEEVTKNLLKLEKEKDDLKGEIAGKKLFLFLYIFIFPEHMPVLIIYTLKSLTHTIKKDKQYFYSSILSSIESVH